MRGSLRTIAPPTDFVSVSGPDIARTSAFINSAARLRSLIVRSSTMRLSRVTDRSCRSVRFLSSTSVRSRASSAARVTIEV